MGAFLDENISAIQQALTNLDVEEYIKVERVTPQEGVISPLLSLVVVNSILMELDSRGIKVVGETDCQRPNSPVKDLTGEKNITCNKVEIVQNILNVVNTTFNIPENADKIVLATVLLHNFLILNNDSQNPEEIGQEFLEDVKLLRSNHSTTEAFDIRETLKEDMHDTFIDAKCRFSRLTRVWMGSSIHNM
ncbi:hypothetical protein FF38_04438 [Lucilia cuprina]|uniref:Uncharacterized protein n=1 Tax=Lucilia cuprina TaxID=7375 RepID=A0A0L0C6L7_LUCCU|nr:hypothetical protein FF38_04438 [Lucilia cuprina]